MKIGIWLGTDRRSLVGGGSSYTDRFLYLVDNYSFHESIEICYLSIVPQKDLKREVINISQIPSWLYAVVRFSSYLSRKAVGLDKYLIKRKGLKCILRGTFVKIVFYSSQCECIDSDFPFISNNWDIGHRSTHSFPELMLNGQYETRESFYKDVLPKALLTICESKTGFEELIRYTCLGRHKIRIMPLFAGGVSSLSVSESIMNLILERFGVTRYKYFYYPAQFWAHKNHVGLLKAFRKFKGLHEGYKLVLSGSDRGNKQYIIKKANEYGLNNDVVFLGFISNEEVYTLYKYAAALVMASHFGPTNMPPIEAMELGCPVACSDIGGHHEILGENAVYFDSYDSNSICIALKEIVSNRDIWKERIINQKSLSEFNSDNALRSLNAILQEAIVIRENWE